MKRAKMGFQSRRPSRGRVAESSVPARGASESRLSSRWRTRAVLAFVALLSVSNLGAGCPGEAPPVDLPDVGPFGESLGQGMSL